MDSHHRKIDLQSPQDLTYLLRNIKNAAQQKLDTHFPPSAAPKDEGDAFRTKVEQLVQQYIMQTFTLALPSLTINGLDASDPALVPNPPQTPSTSDADQNYEPYDPRLAAKVRSLYATLETETTRVAELRREAPPKAAGLYVEKLRAEMEEEQRRIVNAEMKLAGVEGLNRLNVKLERADDVAVNWERGVTGLGGLRGITEGVARLERAMGVVQELEGM